MNPLLQISPFAVDEGAVIGRDPRDVPADDWAGRPLLVGLKAIRAKCLDCAFTAGEVRKCVQTTCPLWHLRMGSVPRSVKIARERAELEHPRSPGISDLAEREVENSGACTAQNDAEKVK